MSFLEHVRHEYQELNILNTEPRMNYDSSFTNPNSEQHQPITPLNNPPMLNISRPTVLRQYYGLNISIPSNDDSRVSLSICFFFTLFRPRWRLTSTIYISTNILSRIAVENDLES